MFYCFMATRGTMELSPNNSVDEMRYFSNCVNCNNCNEETGQNPNLQMHRFENYILFNLSDTIICFSNIVLHIVILLNNIPTEISKRPISFELLAEYVTFSLFTNQ